MKKSVLAFVLYLALPLALLGDAMTSSIARRFMESNKFQLPDYTASRNLIQNPSFEDGLDFWFSYVGNDMPVHGESAVEGRRGVFIDKTTSVTGKHSLRQESNATGVVVPSNNQIPLEKGCDYTLSFYAKTDHPNDIDFQVGGCTETWEDRLKDVPYSLGTEWRRYTYTFTAKKNVVSLSIGNRKATPSVVWLDNVQLEKGQTATDFTAIPASVSLATSTDNNLSQPGEKADARFRIQSATAQEGRLRYVLKDFFGKTVAEGVQPFKTPGGYEPVELPALEVCDTLPSGEYVIQATMELQSGFKHDTFHRVARMKYMNGSHQHKRLFSGAAAHNGGIEFRWDDNLRLYQQMGIGSVVCFGAPAPAFQKLLKSYGMICYGHLFPGQTLGKYDLTRSRNSSKPETSVSAVKDEDIPLIAEACQKIAAANPQIKVWKTLNEPFNQTEDEIKKVVQILTAVRKAVKEVSPEAKILTPDCANVGHTLIYLDTFFRNGGLDACDAIGTHLYAGDGNLLDEDIQRIINVVDHYKPGVEIWSTEGGFYFPYPFPEMGTDVFFGSECRSSHPSYDLGQGERDVCSAQMRYNITALKYASRLVTAQNWNFAGLSSRILFGLSGVPLSEIFAVNTPARMLGNSKFISDLKLGNHIRGYLFDNGSGRPVATLWCVDSKPTLLVETLKEKADLLDCFGNPVKIKDGKLELGHNPIFLIGAKNRVKELGSALEQSEFLVPEEGKTFEIKFKLAANGKLSMVVGNRFKRDFNGTLSTSLDGKPNVARPLALKGYEKLPLELDLPPAQSAIRNVNVGLEFKRAGGASEQWDLPISYFTIGKAPQDFQIDGKGEKWEHVPRNPVGKSTEDYGAGMRWLWDDGQLLCQFVVKDRTFTPLQTIQFPDTSDSVQVFFDSYLDSGIGSHDYDENDQYYCIVPNGNGNVDLFRQLAPTWQLAFTSAGHVPEAKSSFQRDAEGWSFEMAVPMREIQPINLKEGGSVGVFVQAHDYDGQKKLHVAASTDGPEALCWRPPYSYTLMFFIP